MILKKLELFNFRNYRSMFFEPEEKTLILGENGQGKTNLLEAIYFLITGTSFRVSNRDSIIYGDEKEFSICSIWRTKEDSFIDGAGREDIISLNAQREGKKHLYFNRKRSRFSYTTQHFPLVLFSPESLNLLKNSADERRRWLDSWLTTEGLFPSVSRFRKALKQKQGILNHIKKGKVYGKLSRVLLDSSNACFIKESVNLVNYRKKSLKNLLSFMRESAECLFRHLVKAKNLQYKEFLGLRYVIRGMQEIEEEEDLDERTFSILIEKNLNREVESGMCLYGAHRDDFQVLFHGRDVRYYCSQGQLRGLLLALITGQMGWFQEVLDKKPLLLLDDVFSEIDTYFCYNLLYYLEKFSSQMLLTSTQVPECFSKQKGIRVMNIKQATKKKESTYGRRISVSI